MLCELPFAVFSVQAQVLNDLEPQIIGQEVIGQTAYVRIDAWPNFRFFAKKNRRFLRIITLHYLQLLSWSRPITAFKGPFKADAAGQASTRTLALWAVDCHFDSWLSKWANLALKAQASFNLKSCWIDKFTTRISIQLDLSQFISKYFSGLVSKLSFSKKNKL